MPPADFLPGLQKIARKHGILLSPMKCRCGMGRTGKMFAFEHFRFSSGYRRAREGHRFGNAAGRDDGAIGYHDVGAGRARFDVRRQSGVSCGGAGDGPAA